MLNMRQEDEEPPSTETSPENQVDVTKYTEDDKESSGVLSFITDFFKPKPDATLRETIEEYIDNEQSEDQDSPFSDHEKTLLANVLELHNKDAVDIMVPRADIIGINLDMTHEELFGLLSEKQYSRFPVYKETLDNVVGAIHIKDILACIAKNEPVVIADLVRDVPVISPSMDILDLLLQMRITRKHMVLVVDEFGGIDGLITLGDLLESVVGEIDDEHHLEYHAEMSTQADGTILADARVNLDDFEDAFGELLTEEERQENDTLGGLVFFMAGRVPVRGEVIKHNTGMVFEIIEADPRRVNRICIRNIPVTE